jgi:hypothetical protein
LIFNHIKINYYNISISKMERSEEKINFVTNLINDDNWKLVSALEGITIERKPLLGNSIDCFRAYGMVNADQKELADIIWNKYNDMDSIKSSDSDISDYRIVDNIDSNTRICYQVNNLQWPLWPRESVYLQLRVIRDNATYIYMYSIETDAVPQQPDKFVRANINISAYVLIPCHSGCTVYRIAHIDPSGSLPVGIINSYASKTGGMIKHLQKKYNH